VKYSYYNFQTARKQKTLPAAAGFLFPYLKAKSGFLIGSKQVSFFELTCPSLNSPAIKLLMLPSASITIPGKILETHRTCKYVWFLSHAISVKVLKNLRILVYNFLFG
jgi:hypothetical protein